MPNGSIDSAVDYVAQFRAETDTVRPTMAASRTDTFEVQEMLFKALRQFTSDDVDVVVFGSLAR